VGVVAEGGEGAEAAGIDDLVGDEDVLTEPGGGESDRLPRCGARERGVSERPLAGGQGGALVGLDVRAQRRARVGRRHRRQVGVEHVGLDHQRGRRQVVHLHRAPSVPRSLMPNPPV
jgi:hypothetical protein